MQPIKHLSYALYVGAVLVSAAPVQTNGLDDRRGQSDVKRRTALAAFDSWAKRYGAATSVDSRARMFAEGLTLAKARRTAFRELIKADPERALAAAIPAGVRKQLTSEIENELEVPVSGIGDLLVMCVMPAKGSREAEAMRRLVRLNGSTYPAFVYGRRLGEMTKYGILLHGVAIDGVLALHASALAELRPTEAAEWTGPVIDLSEAARPLAGPGPARLARMGQTVYRFASLNI